MPEIIYNSVIWHSCLVQKSWTHQKLKDADRSAGLGYIKEAFDLTPAHTCKNQKFESCPPIMLPLDEWAFSAINHTHNGRHPLKRWSGAAVSSFPHLDQPPLSLFYRWNYCAKAISVKSLHKLVYQYDGLSRSSVVINASAHQQEILLVTNLVPVEGYSKAGFTVA